jgi:glycosyltransferase involved in cell wall biosynthesis
MTDSVSQVHGHFDGYLGGSFEGWAWRPEQPEETVSIQIIADGLLLAELPASQYRADLRKAGIGHGRFGFTFSYDLDTEKDDPVSVSVRVKDGPALIGGEVQIGGRLNISKEDATAFARFVTTALGREHEENSIPSFTYAPPTVNFIVYPDVVVETRSDDLGVVDYSYDQVFDAFLPMLDLLGVVHVVSDPAHEVDALYAEQLSRGETSLFLSFAPPHRTVLGLLCPTVPVFAWGYSTIPVGGWGDDPRNDWRWVLRQTGRALTLSKLAAQAVKASMGPHFPVVAIPTPVWDRRSNVRASPLRPTDEAALLSLDGIVLDTRTVEFSPGMSPPSPPGGLFEATSVKVDGVVFSSVLPPLEICKNWLDIITAFIAAFRDAPDATLVMRMVGSSRLAWWWDFYTLVSSLPPFACRVVVVEGSMDDEGYATLIRATDWVVNASLTEGHCIPLLDFMCADRPAIAPVHTAMTDYIDARCALVVRSEEEFCSWPQDPRMGMTTTRYRVSWSSLRDQLAEAYRITKSDRGLQQEMAERAGRAARAFCNDGAVSVTLDAFLGLARRAQAGAPASKLLADMA